MALDRDDLLAQIGNAFLSFLLYDFAESGSLLLRSEGDCAFRFGAALEAEFPRRVHLGLPLSAATVAEFDPEADKRQVVDVVIADPDGAALEHEAFVDVTYFPRGSKGARLLGAVEADGERLRRQYERGNCTAALLLVVDEGDLLDDSYAAVKHAAGVPVLLASPKAIVRRAYAVQHDVELPLWCPSCESPRLAAMYYVEEETDEPAEESDQWVHGGVAIWGDGRDARFGCRDCGFRGPRRRAYREARRQRTQHAAAPDAAA